MYEIFIIFLHLFLVGLMWGCLVHGQESNKFEDRTYCQKYIRS